MNDHTRLADTAAVTTWAAWFMSHILEINEVLQFVVLCVGIVSGMVAIRYHWKKAG